MNTILFMHNLDYKQRQRVANCNQRGFIGTLINNPCLEFFVIAFYNILFKTNSL